ncbi:MAG: T9SS type A sorting domain-containing protein, partial [Bacteroidota bacterium]
TLSILDLGQNFTTESLTFRQRLNFIQVILTFNFSNWKLQPRNRSDVYGFGTSTGTSVRPLARWEELALKAYPNPATDQVTLEIPLQTASDVQIRVMDASGRTVWSDRRRMEPGQAPLQLETSNWNRGMYLLEVLHQDGLGTARLLISRP